MIGIRGAFGMLVVLTGPVVGQDDTTALQAARHQLALRHLDSALALLQFVHDDRRAAAAQRATAYVLDGVVRFYEGKDSLAARAFRAALTLDPATVPPPLMVADSALGALGHAQVMPMAAPGNPPDTLYTCVPRCVGLDEAPRFLAGFDVSRFETEWGADRNQYGMRTDRGEATLRITIDTLGHVEPGSAELVTSTLPRALEDGLMSTYQDALFSPGRVNRRPVRVRIEFRFTMRPSRGP
ncbi:MAG TPA: hypothetical protein VFP39_09285 [Gemmatimonadales bacterium]|nr:hypothetical protein [Gemmatimonadales bacterium]